MTKIVGYFPSYEEWGKALAEEWGYMPDLHDRGWGANPLADHCDFDGFARAIAADDDFVVTEAQSPPHKPNDTIYVREKERT